MDDKELQQKFNLVAAHLASLAVSQQKAEERQRVWDERQRKADERQRIADERQLRTVDHISRAERILLLLIRAGRRERREWRERHAALIDAQMRTEARMDASFARLSKSQANTDAAIARLTESQERTDVTFAKTDAALAKLAESQAHSDRKFDALMDIVRKDRQEREDKYREG